MGHLIFIFLIYVFDYISLNSVLCFGMSFPLWYGTFFFFFFLGTPYDSQVLLLAMLLEIVPGSGYWGLNQGSFWIDHVQDKWPTTVVSLWSRIGSICWSFYSSCLNCSYAIYVYAFLLPNEYLYCYKLSS